MTRIRTAMRSARAVWALRPVGRAWRHGAWVLAAAAILVWVRCGPLPAGLLDLDEPPSTIVLDRLGERLYEARSAHGLRGEWLRAADVPPRLAAATIAAEDVRFRWHPGVDPIAVSRAALRNLRGRRVEEGGSTITQQVIKLLRAQRSGGPVGRGWRAKVTEALFAVRLEHRLSKHDILGLYLNLAPYGNQIQGAQRAARAYFGRDISTLTVAETALLAALPQQPGRFNPWTHPERVSPRQAYVLSVMARRGWISAADYASARSERVAVSRNSAAFLAPHFVSHVMADVAAARPRVVQTTLDATLQRTVLGIIAAERQALADHHAGNVAVAVLDNRSGDWLAWEGSGDYFDTTHGGAIDGVTSPRQPGSTLKPFTYAAAFERGFHPGRVLADVPSQFETAKAGVLYSPRNYDGRFRGPLLARAALAGSENVPAVALASQIGVPTVARLLRRAGFTTLDSNAAHYGVGLTLGNAEVRLDELVTAYAAFARGGEPVVPRKILAVDGTDQRPPPDRVVERLVSPRTAFWITDVLSDAEARAYVFGRGGSLEFPFPVAAKTGTSQSYFDNWTVGYTRDVTVGVWVGNFDRRPLRGSSGVTGAGPIFHAVMLAAVEHMRGSLPIGETDPIVSPPPDVFRQELCAASGMTATDACPTRVSEWIPEGSGTQTCSWHHLSDEGLVTVWPEPFHDWARQHGLLRDPASTAAGPILERAAGPIQPSPLSRRARALVAATGLTIVRPLGGALFLIDPTLRSEFQTLTLSARGAGGSALEWFVDGTLIGVDTGAEPMRWPLARGRHDLLVKDATGQSARTWIEVR